MGYRALVSAAAPALGPTYGGIVNQTLGWRYIFVILIPVLILTLILGISTIEEKHEPEKVPVDIWGIIFIMLTFLGLVYGFANMAWKAMEELYAERKVNIQMQAWSPLVIKFSAIH